MGMGDPTARLSGWPRSSTAERDIPDTIAYGLASLRDMNGDSMRLLIWLNNDWPDHLIPALTWFAAQPRSGVSQTFVKYLIKYAGPEMLERAFGKRRLRELLQRYPGWGDPAGLRGRFDGFGGTDGLPN